MADFCKQCADDLGFPGSDFKFEKEGNYAVLCEGCNWVVVNERGECQHYVHSRVKVLTTECARLRALANEEAEKHLKTQESLGIEIDRLQAILIKVKDFAVKL